MKVVAATAGFSSRGRPFRPVLRLRTLLCCFVVLTAGCGDDGDRHAVRDAWDAAEQGDADTAFQLAAAVPESHPDWSQARLLLGQIARDRGNLSTAVQYLEQLPRDGSPESVHAARMAAEICLSDCRLADAVRHLEYQVQNAPDDVSAQSTLLALLRLGGDRQRADQVAFRLLKAGFLPLSDLVAFSQPERIPSEDRRLRDCAEREAPDRVVRFGSAVAAVHRQRPDEAEAILEQLVAEQPDAAAGQALLGELYLETAPHRLPTWFRSLPDSVRDHPGVWFVRGLWARQHQQTRAAVRCFWETLQSRPLHRRASYQLGQSLVGIDADAAVAFAEHARQLEELAGLTERVLIDEGKTTADVERLIGLLVATGRHWEAWAWAVQIRRLSGQAVSLDGSRAPLQRLQADRPPRILKTLDLSRRYDYSAFPAPDEAFSRGAGGAGEPVAPDEELTAVRYEDAAAELGVSFLYEGSTNPQTSGVRIFESTGGGAGVLDWDLDGWPDVFLPQGEIWPPGDIVPAPVAGLRDTVYHNRGGRFVDVTNESVPRDEDGYGQGVAVGDINNDGFPDLYVANIGRNQLLLNQGDGTFTDATEAAGLTEADWTTSCLILDLNADGHPDLFDVNYLQGEDVFLVECSENRCSVRDFEGAPDDVLLSAGAGTFRPVPDATPERDGKGLGAVAFYPEDSSRPSLFIANDQVPNFFLCPAAEDGRYDDRAYLTGLALNRDGRPTACMGVAAGDLNRDQRTDLFVTNFEAEANCLYEQREGGLFADVIAGSGLYAAGIPYVGWGAQFTDADNDGDDDLFIANGHVADFGVAGEVYRMPLQFFANRGGGRFRHQPSASDSGLFERILLGRAVVLLDQNRDGREDVLVTSLQDPPVVAINRTATAGHWLRLRLSARRTARDAFGARVELTDSAGRVHWRQLLAGSGYEASNERVLHFGLGQETRVDRLVIRWPSGAVDVAADLPADRRLDVVESRPSLTAHSAEGAVESFALRAHAEP